MTECQKARQPEGLAGPDILDIAKVYRELLRDALRDARRFYRAYTALPYGREKRLNRLYFTSSLSVARRARAHLRRIAATEDAKPP